MPVGRCEYYILVVYGLMCGAAFAPSSCEHFFRTALVLPQVPPRLGSPALRLRYKIHIRDTALQAVMFQFRVVPCFLSFAAWALASAHTAPSASHTGDIVLTSQHTHTHTHTHTSEFTVFLLVANRLPLGWRYAHCFRFHALAPRASQATRLIGCMLLQAP